ncbi:HNH endonuclease [Yersinia intermedia]|uniref:HNH endonuclease n=1 Tax=Yersinia intermedia TaxID=631 RepID=UPI000679A496|nr:HNH endonuclease [Yersinia intermedia]
MVPEAKYFSDYYELLNSQNIRDSAGIAAVKTEGIHLVWENGTPVSTGNWGFVAPNDIDYLLIFYVQNKLPTQLWLGEVVGTIRVSKPKSDGDNYQLYIRNTELIGETTQNWKTFTDNGQSNGIRILQRKAVSPSTIITEEMIMGIPAGNRHPQKIAETRDVIERCEKVKKYTLLRANGQCQGCFNETLPLLTDSQSVFLEVHHVKFLRNFGPDTVDNTVALCPRCHKQAHHSYDRHKFMKHLYEMNDFLEP